MKIISVTGTSSETGKTTVGTFIIKALGNICALKITVRHEGQCPRHRADSCDGCTYDEENSLFRIITNPTTLSEPGKDTARYIEAGAPKVVWLQTNSECAREGIRRALRHFDSEATVLVEGNRFLAVRDADVAIMVVSPGLKKIKHSATEILGKINLLVINKRSDHRAKDIAAAREQLMSAGCKVPAVVINPHNPDPTAQTVLLERIRGVLNPAVDAVL